MTNGIIKTVIGETVKVEFNDTDTPRDVMKKVCEEDFEAVVPFFENRAKAELFRDTGNLNLEASQFSLIDGSEKTLSLDFDIPILEQMPDDKKIGKDIPTFLVTVDAIVGAPGGPPPLLQWIGGSGHDHQKDTRASGLRCPSRHRTHVFRKQSGCYCKTEGQHHPHHNC